MEMRAKYVQRELDHNIDRVEHRSLIMGELREQGGHFAEVAALARYGSIMLHQYAKNQVRKEPGELR